MAPDEREFEAIKKNAGGWILFHPQAYSSDRTRRLTDWLAVVAVHALAVFLVFLVFFL